MTLILSTAADFGELDPPQTLTFTSTQSTDCVDIPIVDDILIENTEVFNVELNSNDFQVIINIGSALVLIADNDGKIQTLLYIVSLWYTWQSSLQRLSLNSLKTRTLGRRMLAHLPTFHLPFDLQQRVVFSIRQ